MNQEYKKKYLKYKLKYLQLKHKKHLKYGGMEDGSMEKDDDDKSKSTQDKSKQSPDSWEDGSMEEDDDDKSKSTPDSWEAVSNPNSWKIVSHEGTDEIPPLNLPNAEVEQLKEEIMKELMNIEKRITSKRLDMSWVIVKLKGLIIPLLDKLERFEFSYEEIALLIKYISINLKDEHKEKLKHYEVSNIKEEEILENPEETLDEFKDIIKILKNRVLNVPN